MRDSNQSQKTPNQLPARTTKSGSLYITFGAPTLNPADARLRERRRRNCDIHDFSDLEIDGSNVTNGFFGRRWEAVVPAPSTSAMLLIGLDHGDENRCSASPGKLPPLARIDHSGTMRASCVSRRRRCRKESSIAWIPS
jgi:hypothetical protein